MQVRSYEAALKVRPAPGVKPSSPKSEPADEFTPNGDPPRKKHTLTKVLAYSMLATTGLGLVAGTGAHVLAHAPICQTEQFIGWENNRLCVSPELGVRAGGVWRTIRGIPHVQGTASHHNDLVQPGKPTGRPLDGELNVVSWNLHHSRTPDASGARRTLQEQLAELQQENPDVVLLQEVDPADVRAIVDAMGMKGVYAQTTMTQGNLILIHPDLTVEADQIVHIAGAEQGDSGLTTLVEWARALGKHEEPRNIQLVQVRTPDGQSLMLWNTHYPTRSYSEEQHRIASETVDRVLEEARAKGIPVIGGGDMNAGSRTHQVIAPILEQGYQGVQERIDWLFSANGVKIEDFSAERPTDANGVQLSDHPLVRGQVQLG